MDLEGDPPAFDLGTDSNIQVDSLLQLYQYSHGGVPGQGGPVPREGNFADLNSTLDSDGDIIKFDKGPEIPQDPSNPIFDTIHEQSLLAPKRKESDDLDLDGKTPNNIRRSDEAYLNQLNQVPGGMTPSAYADINGNKTVNVKSPDGAPIPDNLLFHGDKDPTKYKGKQISGVDLHEHLLQNSYTYSHGLSNTVVKASTSAGDQFTYQDLDIDIRNNKPTQYIDNLPK